MLGAHLDQHGEFVIRHDESPTRRVNPSGSVVWVARWTDRHGNRRIGWRPYLPGTYPQRGPCRRSADSGLCCAAHAIHKAYELDRAAPDHRSTLGHYVTEVWLELHPRSAQTDLVYMGRLHSILDVELEGTRLGKMPLADVKRRHAVWLVDVMLREHGRAVAGASSVIQTLSAMWQDAIDDGYAKSANPFHRLTIRADDRRAHKAARRPTVWSWEQMHEIAAAAGRPIVRVWGDVHPNALPALKARLEQRNQWRALYGEAMVRVLADCGLRLGEDLALQHRDLKLGSRCDEVPCRVQGPHLHVRRHALRGELLAGTKSSAERVAPLADTVAALLSELPSLDDRRHSETSLFPDPRGRVWHASSWYQNVWSPAIAMCGLAARPHDFRHSWISYMRAAAIDPADVAAAAGHTVAVQNSVYTHALGRSFDAIRAAVQATE